MLVQATGQADDFKLLINSYTRFGDTQLDTGDARVMPERNLIWPCRMLGWVMWNWKRMLGAAPNILARLWILL